MAPNLPFGAVSARTPGRRLVTASSDVIGPHGPTALHEIVLPETKAETEWIAGRPLQKMNPTFDHATVQKAVLIALDGWAGDAGYVQPEWRFRLAPPGEPLRPLVADVAYVAAERVRALSNDELQAPALAPDAAIEVLSPGDRRSDVDAKIDVYLRAGTHLVVVLDPATRSCELHDPHRGPSHLSGNDVLRHPALPGFRLALDESSSARCADGDRQNRHEVSRVSRPTRRAGPKAACPSRPAVLHLVLSG